MVRGSSIALGAGLIVLWLVGLANHATPWLTWMMALGGLAGLGIAASMSSRSSPRSVEQEGWMVPVGAPVALAVALILLWVVGLSVGASAWMAWWSFVFGVAFLILGLLAMGERTPTIPTLTHPRVT